MPGRNNKKVNLDDIEKIMKDYNRLLKKDPELAGKLKRIMDKRKRDMKRLPSLPLLSELFRLIGSGIPTDDKIIDMIKSKNFEKVASRLTGSLDFADKEHLAFLGKLLKLDIFPEEINYLDIGPGSGIFTRELDKLVENKKKLRITLADIREIKAKRINRKKINAISGYDVIENEPDISDLIKNQHIIVMKEVMKFYKPTARGQAFRNLEKSMSHGTILVTGGEYNPDKPTMSAVKSYKTDHGFAVPRSVMKIMVKVGGKDGKLVKVDPVKFFKRVRDLKRGDYLRNLESIVKETRAEVSKRSKSRRA